MRESLLQSRLVHYLSLSGLLLGLVLGGFITMNCRQSYTLPQGQLVEGQDGVKPDDEAGIAFDTTAANVSSADYQLPPKINITKFGGAEEEVDCIWKAVRDYGPLIVPRHYGAPPEPTLNDFVAADPNDVSLVTDNVARIQKNENRPRSVRFVCQFAFNGIIYHRTHTVRVRNF